jgi:hypothetical protein
VAGREGGVKRRKRILLEQPKVFTSIFFKETKHCLGVQKGNKEMVCGMHALLCLFVLCVWQWQRGRLLLICLYRTRITSSVCWDGKKVREI